MTESGASQYFIYVRGLNLGLCDFTTRMKVPWSHPGEQDVADLVNNGVFPALLHRVTKAGCKREKKRKRKHGTQQSEKRR